METKEINYRNGRFIGESLDTWLSFGLRDIAVPEASGSSARVFNYHSPEEKKSFRSEMAIKIMRPDKISYATPLFEQEMLILGGLPYRPGLTRIFGCGFIKPDPLIPWPEEVAPLTKKLQVTSSAQNITGVMELFEVGETDLAVNCLRDKVTEGWLPFLLLEKRWEDNLYLGCDSGYTRGEFLNNFNMQTIIEISIQICELLDYAHSNGAIYRDHKLLHYYWNSTRRQVIMLDWNIGRWEPGKLTSESVQFDLLQFSARALHHLFTGHQAPGSVKVGPNRPEEIENAPKHYKATYSYDIQKRLNGDELVFLEKALDGVYTSATKMIDDLKYLRKIRS